MKAKSRIRKQSPSGAPVIHPLRSLYRLYETMMGGDEHLPVVGYETEYFFGQGRRAWDLHRILILAIPIRFVMHF